MTEEPLQYDLKQSKKEIGVLYPAIADKYGRIIDGKHRLDVDPEWPTFLLSDIDTDEKFLVARIIANTHRRVVPAEEKTEWLAELAEKTGWTPKEMAERLGVSYSWVMKYLPDKHKTKTWEQEEPITRCIIGEKSETQRTEGSSAAEEPLKEAENVLQPIQNLEAGASTLAEKAEIEPTTLDAEPEPVKETKPKTFKCRACQEMFEIGKPWRPVTVTLCPECEMQFQMWLADRNLERQETRNEQDTTG